MWRKSGHWPERRFKHDLHLSYLPRPRPVPTPQLPGIRDLTADIGLPQPSTSRRSMVQVCRIFQVSGALWAERDVRGVVGRAITIDCHYAATYRSHTKYWCDGWTHQCLIIVATNGQHGWRGRVSVTDDTARGIFTVTVEDLHSGDTGRYSCGISTFGNDPVFNVYLQVSDEPVSVPVLGFLSPANVSRLGGSVLMSCESVQGSLPIQYTWYEKTPSVDSKVSDTSKLDLHCQSFKHQHHQYYCTASNNRGTKSSEIVNVTVFNKGGICSYVTEINSTISGALWAKNKVRGVVGRAITINCHYAATYRSHSKYLCRVWGHQCTMLVETNGQHGWRGRRSITDNPARGIFTVTVEDLRSYDTGCYSCGITTPGDDPMFDIHLQVSDEPVSVPVLGFLSPANVSRLGGSVSMSCESVQGSVPVQYAWYEKTPSRDVKIFDTSVLDLYCQSFELQHHQYYCTASNNRGEKSSEMVNVTVFKKGGICSYVTEVNGTKPVSVPVLGFQSPANARCLGHSVTVSCESVYGSLPITYAWYEKMPSEDSKISNNTKLDLHCESLKGQYYQYYCTASNVNGTKSSEMVNVSISNSGTCRNVIEANSTGPMYFCDISVTESMTTAQRKQHTPFPIPTYIIVLSVLGILLIILVICLLCYLKWKNRVSKCNTSRSGGKNETQEMATLEGSIVYADLHQLRTNEAAAQLDNNENGIVYADVQFQRKSRVGHSITDEDNVTYADIKLQSHPRKPKQKGPSPGTLQDSAQAIYANVGS
ncbi:Fc receptor-like protein 5 isoform X2 [Pristis pectinata]|uniref:Fc receptor-like protein 5 isoform X2 n=1 Tax=Pristis pectinata TaxID=685728 RepID=UPI00223CC04F|nr:Fc receptor-like protein 5 isoform X2 [Pristis pectinata]